MIFEKACNHAVFACFRAFFYAQTRRKINRKSTDFLKSTAPPIEPGIYSGWSVKLSPCKNICVCVACICSTNSTKNKTDYIIISFVLLVHHFGIAFYLRYGTRCKYRRSAFGTISVPKRHFVKRWSGSRSEPKTGKTRNKIIVCWSVRPLWVWMFKILLCDLIPQNNERAANGDKLPRIWYRDSVPQNRPPKPQKRKQTEKNKNPF